MRGGALPAGHSQAVDPHDGIVRPDWPGARRIQALIDHASSSARPVRAGARGFAVVLGHPVWSPLRREGHQADQGTKFACSWSCRCHSGTPENPLSRW